MHRFPWWIGLMMACMPGNALGQGRQQDTQLAPVWKVSHHDSAASLRGLFVDPLGQWAWASGSGGTVLRSPDRGATWENVSPPDAAAFDFRDIHGLSDGAQAVAMAVGSPARIYRTRDAGRRWEVVFEDTRPEIFLDAMAFWNDEQGIAFGDPIRGRFVILHTSDGGASWSELDFDQQPEALEGEGGFAASGTCLCLRGNQVWIGLGGARQQGDPPQARLLVSDDRGATWRSLISPLKSAAASGIFSLVFSDPDRGIAVGGTYDEPDDSSSHIGITEDGGRTWTRPGSTPRGYRSCVAVCNQIRWGNRPRLLAVGKTGNDYSTDGGHNWKALDDQGFYAVACDLAGNTVIAVGADGRIGVLPTRELELD